VIRAIESGYGYGCGYGRSDPQGMPLTGNAPWGTPGHAALTGIVPWGQRPLRSLPPRVWNGRNQVAVQRARVCIYTSKHLEGCLPP
jgi:hypothetical protein